MPKIKTLPPNLDTPLGEQLVFVPVAWSPQVPDDEPTQEEIALRAAAIRATWDERREDYSEGSYSKSNHPATIPCFSARIFERPRR